MLTSAKPADVILKHSLPSAGWNIMTAVISRNVNLCVQNFVKAAMLLHWTTGKKFAAQYLESSDHGPYIMMDGAMTA
jgi:hypothetical protein